MVGTLTAPPSCGHDVWGFFSRKILACRAPWLPRSGRPTRRTRQPALEISICVYLKMLTARAITKPKTSRDATDWESERYKQEKPDQATRTQ